VNKRQFLAPLLACVAALLNIGSLHAEDLPDYMKGLVGVLESTPADTANANLLALNAAMFDLYDAAGQTFTKNILANHPVILALFSGAGGNFTLYQPGKAPVSAPPVPIVYPDSQVRWA